MNIQKNHYFMDKSLFQSIQNNFRTYLKGKTHPVPVVPLPIPAPVKNHNRIVEMERTSIFGKDDEGIGYRISTEKKTILRPKK